eukprot:1407070-Pleurochrysis_carterae.AAC.1
MLRASPLHVNRTERVCKRDCDEGLSLPACAKAASPPCCVDPFAPPLRLPLPLAVTADVRQAPTGLLTLGLFTAAARGLFTADFTAAGVDVLRAPAVV